MLNKNFYPLSSMQQGLLFHSLYEPRSGIYIEQMICSLHENLKVSVLSQSWQRVVERHSILRTSFHWDDSHLLQQLVHRQVKLPVEQQDWRRFSKSEQDNRLQAYLQEDRQHGFDLAEAPLMRLALFQLAEADYKLVWTFHHALLDGRSIFIILKEVFAFYEAFYQNQDIRLEEAYPYHDYIDWLGQQSFAKAEEFWRQQLRGFEAPTQLSAVKELGGETTSYKTQKVRLSMARTSALQALAREHQLTLNTLAQGAWALLLNRYSGKDDVVFGATRACRHSALKSMESMVGLFINTLPVRVQVNPDKPLLRWLKELRSQWITLRDYEHTPLVKIQEWSEVSKGLPLFESLLVFENYELNAALARQGGKWKHREFELLEQPNSPLTLAVCAESELLLKIDYDCRRFDDDAIARMLGHIETLLEGFAANPQQCLGDLPLLTEAEKHQLLVQWNETQVDYPKDACIHQLFEAQVERTPDAVAVMFEKRQLTYRELNARANQLARYLQGLGVEPEVLVGICMERSLEMIVGLLGILKAGGGYVPLDLASPKERLAHILSDSQVSVLLTQEKLAIEFPENRTRVVCFDTDWEAIVRESAENPVSGVKGSNLAYVIYTSGSTGQPKGVTIEHGSVLNLAKGLHQAIYAAREEGQLRVSLNGFLAFDTSVKQVIQLLYGHTLDIVPESLRFDGAALLSYLQRRQIDVFDCTPSQLRLLISAGLLDSNISPQHVLVGGEPIDESTWQRLITAKNIRFYNVYGPTECTVDATLCFLRASEVKPVIGRPIANAQVYILNSQLQPVPIGIVGELHIGGAGLARGYLNRPELTAEKFISNPFSDEPGAKLYKTGDLARYLPDGNIEFCGRIDNQVKIRGFRIELGEIEAVLGQHPAVRDCAVVAREDDAGSQRLVAYVVPSQEHTIAVNDLSRFLKQKLPNYMVPSLFLLLEALPLTPNGKVDRKALTTVQGGTFGVAESFVAPRTPIEELLAGIWAEVLGLEQVGIHDNFFEIGGHSLKATQVISRVRDVFSTELPIRCLFEFPTVADLSKQIEDIRSQESNLSAAIPIQPIAREEELALSFAQQRLWFLHQLEGQNTTYNILSGLHLIGTLDGAALEQSIAEIVARHESLRTTFSTVDGVAVQVIHANANIPVSSVNLEAFPEVERVAEVQRLVHEESQRPFDLAHEPLLRITLLRLGRESHILLLTMHHIVSDGWSMGIFFKELSTLYAAFSQGESASLPELPIQYADFAHWQRQWLQGEVLETQIEYWQQQLTGAPPLLDLPTDRPRPPVQTFRGGTQTFELSETLTQQIKKLSSQSGTTLFMTLLAAFITLLGRYSNQEDIAVGSPIASRNRSELERIIGFFANTLVLRVEFSGSPSFRELLRRVRQVTLDAYSHQDLPFEKLVQELQPERNLSYNPLFQVMFVLQNAGSEDWEFPGLILTPLQIENVTAKFDLTLAMEERESGLRGVLEYNSDLFDATTITRMLGHFQMLLAGIVANPESPIYKLPLLTEAERHQLLVEWNDTRAEYPKNKCIHQLFEEQVEKTPDAVALVFEDQQLTYKELNSRANQLAHYLQQLGVRSETLVGICVERSPLMVIGLLGILKAGGAYVPLDPSYPQERFAFMLEDAQVSLLLTQQQLIKDLPNHQVGRVVCLDANWSAINQENQVNPTSFVSPENVAYVMYTSGSTGQPKGVCVIHQGVVRLVKDTNYGNFTSEEVFLQLAPIAFDASTFEIWGSLLNGAKLVLFPSDKPSLSELGQLIQQHQITTLWLTAGLFHLMVDERLDDLKPLSQLLAGGDVLSVPHVQKVLTHLEDCQLINGYGPTENTTFTCCYPITKAESCINSVPIGRPIANTQVYILDTYQQPVPIGVAGELHIGGAGLARGYLNRSELTAEKFIPNPFSDEPNAKLYKTGDLARYLPNGNIEFCGRIDNQVKIRGFRIELGEVEAVLRQHPAVRECAVIAREDETEKKRLVAYVVLSQETISIGELRRFLKQKLPDYTIPSAFVLLEAMPLTPNGKVDRRALPSPDSSCLSLDTNFVPPRTPTEEVLAGIWRDILGLERVGVQDNFFQIGGHSLLAIQVLFRIKENYHIEIPLENVFAMPTIQNIANYIDKLPNKPHNYLKNLRPKFPKQNFTLSIMQQRMWNFEQLKCGAFPNNICVAIYLIGSLHIETLRKVFNEIVRRHEALRTSFVIMEGHPTQRIEMELIPSLSIIDLSNFPENVRYTKAKQHANNELKKHFNLSQAPLVRFKLLRMREEKHILLFTVNHIVFDGWSLNIFLEEVSLLYRAFYLGEPSPLPEPYYQYSDFVSWQKEILTGKRFHKFFSYWRTQLNGTSPLLELAEEKQRNPRGVYLQFKIKSSIYRALEKLSNSKNVTLFIMLLAAFKILLYRYTGKNEILVATPFPNRIEEFKNVIGAFNHTQILRTDFSKDSTFDEILNRVREAFIGAYSHQAMPFRLIDIEKQEWDKNYTLLLQIFFAVQHKKTPPLSLPNIQSNYMQMDFTVALYPLSLFMQVTPDGLSGILIYNKALFNKHFICQMVDDFTKTLENIVNTYNLKL